jgi:F-type H+-transporting ATPase subunit delta
MLREPTIFAGSGPHCSFPGSEVPLEFQGLAPPARDGAGSADGKAQKRAKQVAGAEPIVSGMAGRYANALFELALDAKSVDAVKADLEKFESLVASSADLTRLVRSPVFGAGEQTQALAAVLARFGISGLTANFLQTVASNRRLFAIGEMIKAFRAQVARWKGEISAEITAAEPLSDRHLDALKSALKSVTGGKSIDLKIKIDPAIIGGLVVKLGSRMVDTSLRTKLGAIKHAMKEAG